MAATIAEQISQQLAEQILSGKLKPGQRIEEKRVTDQFDVSRTPVREALHQLASTGLIAMQPHRGATVVDMDVEQLTDMFEAQAEIEALCAKMAAIRMSNIERKKLQQVAEESAPSLKKSDHKKYSSSNEALHKLIYKGAHNQSLEQIALNLWNRVAPFRRSIFFKQSNRMSHSFDEHQTIIQAIIKGDKDKAYSAMYEHVTNSSLNAIEFFNRSKKV